MLRPWPLTLKNNRVPPLMIMMNCTKLYDPEVKHTVRSLSCLQGFSTKRCYSLDLWPWKIRFLLSWWWSIVPTCKWCYDLDLWPWKTIGFILSWCWSIVPTCKWCYGLDLWPWKTIAFILSRCWSSVPNYMTLKHMV
jgi:hypothetical protein